MAVKFVNRLTGSIMWVSDDRVDEYLKLGYKKAEIPSEKPTEKAVEKVERKRRSSAKGNER